MGVKKPSEFVKEYSFQGTEEKTVKTPSVLSKIYSKTRQASKKLDSLGVEIRGIQRIPPYERGTSKQFLSVAGLWLSAAGGLSSMSSYFLGPLLFELTFRQSLVSGLISMAIGCGVAAYCSIMGPQSGCRQMVTARYLFGWYFVKFVALVSIIGVMGWSIVNCVVGGEMLAAVSDDKIPLWVGIIIVTALSFLVAIFGIKQVLRVETMLSVPVLTCFLLLYISASDKFNLVDAFQNDDVDALTIKGNWLSFFSLCYSITSTWGSITSDYYILFPEDTPSHKVFLLTFFGTLLPTTFVGVLGLILAACAAAYEPWQEAYDTYGMGGLLHAGFSRWNGFGKFCVVVLILSLISNNIINTYSAAFSLQLSSVHMARVPRWIWAIACTVFYLVCALVGRNHFSTILGNFLPMVGYWISIYFIILLEENTIFRTHFLQLYTKEFPSFDGADEHRGAIPGASSQISLRALKANRSRFSKAQRRYNWDMWNNPNALTHGYAATAAFLVGVVGVVLGMAQAYWIGPIARHFGEYGGDLAMWLSMGFSGAAYPGLRYLELRRYGR
ncbi:LADA_0G03664g1_1 [Lachancea dasiensis]|uniref:Vitamin B6 transporter TPN1 n=1 Tax=Lachancea dasiensis TaxID=1072105 RepID=A0A1G4JRS2_9SACH|nr:LADA_0G03664g1_1 [Lachancea dasiensis]